MEAQSVQLGAEDYQALLGMLTSQDVSVRSEGQGLAKKLTPSEQQEFFDFQQQTAKGRDATSNREDAAIVSGIPVIGSITPEGALGAGMAGRAVGQAVTSAAPGLVPRVAAGVVAAAKEAYPLAKYEAIKTALRATGIPEPAAVIIAGAATGYKRGAKGAADVAPAEAGAAARAETPLELTRRLKAENHARVAATSPAESVSGGTPPPAGPPLEPVRAGSPGKSPQQILNEEGLTRRRAEYQARQAAAAKAEPLPPAEPAPKPPKPTMTTDESKAYLAMRVAGKTDAQARDAILASRAMNERYGLKPPTTAETKFPKGQRGKSVGPGEP